MNPGCPRGRFPIPPAKTTALRHSIVNQSGMPNRNQSSTQTKANTRNKEYGGSPGGTSKGLQLPRSAVSDLAKKRLEAVRTAFKQAGADASRLTEMKVAERPDTEGQIALEVMEPETPRPSKVRELIRKLKGDDGDE